MSYPLHEIKPLNLGDTFLTLYTRVNDSITVLNAIRIYDINGTGGILHKRKIIGLEQPDYPTAAEVLEINFARTGANNYGYGLGIVNQTGVNIDVGEGITYGVALRYQEMEQSSSFVGTCGGNAFVHEYDLVAVAATGSRGDGAYRPLKVYAKDSLPYKIDGSHRFSGDIFFDGSQVVVNAAQLHIDDKLLFIASAGNTDNPEYTSGLSDNATLGGGSGAGLLIKGASGDKFFTYRKSDAIGNYYSFYSSENIETTQNKGFVSPYGQFKFIGISGSAPAISLRTAGQDAATVPTGWKMYQSVTGDSVGSLKIKREGITDIDAIELFSNSEVKIGNISSGTAGDGSFRTQAGKFSIPGTREKGVLHHSWLNRDVVEIKATADGGVFAEPTASFKPGTVLTYNSLGQYKKATWSADPFDGYKDAEVVGIIEKITSDDYILQVPVQGASYTTSIFSQFEPVSIVGNGKTVFGYVYESLPASGLSGIKVFVDSFPSGVTVGSFAIGGSLFVGGATLKGSADDDIIGVCASVGITVNPVNYAVIVRQGVFDIPDVGQGATGYDAVVGLTAGYLFYLAATGGVTYSSGNLFDPEAFFLAKATVAKPLFIYMGSVDGKRQGLFQNYQGLGLTYSITSYQSQPVYYSVETGELNDFSVIGEVSGRNKILNSGFDLWSRLDVFGQTYEGMDGGLNKGITFNSNSRFQYPFGSSYSNETLSGTIKAGYIADSYFFDTYNTGRQIGVSRSPVSSALPSMPSEPNYELVLTQSDLSSGDKARLYSVIPEHTNLSDTDMNFSFFAKTDASSLQLKVGVAYVWGSGSTYAKITNYHAFVSDGVATTGGAFDFYTDGITSSYARYQFAFSSESLSYPGASLGASLVAPFIEIGTLGVGESLHLTGLQLSKGISPKPYEKRPLALEKAECDRFFQNVVVGNGGYYPIFTGLSGPSIFTAVNLQTPFVAVPQVANALDLTIEGIVGASATGDPVNIRKNSLSLFRSTEAISSTYHRYFETLYSLDASGFSGTVASRLTGLA